jgi:hypothetical protein
MRQMYSQTAGRSVLDLCLHGRKRELGNSLFGWRGTRYMKRIFNPQVERRDGGLKQVGTRQIITMPNVQVKGRPLAGVRARYERC